MWFGTHGSWTPNGSGPIAAPVDMGPCKRAVLSYRGRWYPFPTLADALEYACGRCWDGARIRLVGSRAWCAVILPAVDVFAVSDGVPIGMPDCLELPWQFGEM